MPVIREEVTIRAPAARVWRVVHEELEAAPRWTSYLASAEVVGGKKPGAGSKLRYELDLSGWKGTLELEQDVFEPARRCAGRFVGGPLRGTWSYAYKEGRGATRLTYEMDYELTGFLRFAGGLLKGQYESGIRDSMGALKRYVESGATA